MQTYQLLLRDDSAVRASLAELLSYVGGKTTSRPHRYLTKVRLHTIDVTDDATFARLIYALGKKQVEVLAYADGDDEVLAQTLSLNHCRRRSRPKQNPPKVIRAYASKRSLGSARAR